MTPVAATPTASQGRPPEGTIRDWLDLRAERDGERISHVFPGGEALTWARLRAEAMEVASYLRGQGVAPGETVALMAPNGRDAVLALFGGFYGGFRVALINLVAGPEAIRHALDHSEARVVMLDADQKTLFEAACTARPVAARPIPVRAGTDGAGPSTSGAPQSLSPQDDALLMYTSGTTGRPKGVLHSHASLLAGGWNSAVAHRLTPADRALCVLPLYHINGLCVTLMAPLVSGGSVVVCDRFSASRFWEECATQEVTWFSVVPTIVSHLLHGASGPDAATRARIGFGRSASSALAVETHQAFEARFDIPLVETMGLTETAAQILSNPLPPGDRRIGSPGIAWGNEVAVVTADLQPAASGVEGEIVVRGPNVMRGYFRDEAATAAAMASDGWFRTGDLGRMDADGYVFVTGRLKELIIKGGENVAPREVDEALYAHPDVVEAAAFARPCARYGERIEAAVKLRDGACVDAATLRELCEARLGAFKCPDVIHILPDLPKGPSGKIQRLRLAEMTT